MRSDSRREIHAALAIDAGFVMQAAVVIRSLAQRADAETRYCVHVLGDRLDAEHLGQLDSVTTGGRVRLDFIDASGAIPEALPTNPGISRAAYFRIALPDLLPQSVDRVVYLDADVVVCDDLAELWSADLAGKSTGAVRSGWCPWVAAPGGLDNWGELGIEPDQPYFNSGVLLLDLEVWRSRRLTDQVIGYLADQGNAVELMDQEALNAVLARDWAPLHPRWNQQKYFFDRRSLAHVVFPVEQLVSATTNPGIVHFLSRAKPWKPGCDHPEAWRWSAALEGTPWSGWTVPSTPLHSQVTRRVVAAWNVLRHGSIHGGRRVSRG